MVRVDRAAQKADTAAKRARFIFSTSAQHRAQMKKLAEEISAVAKDNQVTRAFNSLQGGAGPQFNGGKCHVHLHAVPKILAEARARRRSEALGRVVGFVDDEGKKQRLWLNDGLILRFGLGKMSLAEKRGFAGGNHHLSHLCGNWFCGNVEHLHVERNVLNIKRNTCFSQKRCVHEKHLNVHHYNDGGDLSIGLRPVPACLIDLKICPTSVPCTMREALVKAFPLSGTSDEALLLRAKAARDLLMQQQKAVNRKRHLLAHFDLAEDEV